MVRLVSVSGRHNGYALSIRAAVFNNDSLSVVKKYDKVKSDKRRSSVKRSAGYLTGVFDKTGKVK